MKASIIKLLAIIMAILIVISGLSITVSATQPTAYSKISNSGTRNEVCTSLAGTSASTYYTGDYTYDNLIESDDIQSDLHELMKSTHTKITNYNFCRDNVWYVDCEQNDTTHATTLYTGHSMTSSEWTPTWSCNREHVWPKSLGGNTTSGGGADLHHIRPAEGNVNTIRNNRKYGYVDSGKAVTGTTSGLIGGRYDKTEDDVKGYYEPEDNVKGDVARIILYVYVRWGSDWGADSITKVFQSVDVLLEWCEIDPVDTWEMGRNEVIQNIQGNRNVFIDYPELAWQIFGKEVPEDMVTPSGEALDGNVSTPPSVDDPVDGNTPDGDAANVPETFVLKSKIGYVTDQTHIFNSKTELVLTTDKNSAASMKLVNNSDGTVSFKSGNKFLFADGINVKFVDTEDGYTKFVLEKTADGYFVKCANATYNGKDQYLEIYEEYLTCFGMRSDTSIYTFTFEAVESSDQTPDDTTQQPDPSVPPVSNDPDVGNNPDDTNGEGSDVTESTVEATEKANSNTEAQIGSQGTLNVGCASSITGYAMVISVFLLLSVVTLKKKED